MVESYSGVRATEDAAATECLRAAGSIVTFVSCDSEKRMGCQKRKLQISERLAMEAGNGHERQVVQDAALLTEGSSELIRRCFNLQHGDC